MFDKLKYVADTKLKEIDLTIIIPTFRRELEVVQAAKSVLAIQELSVEVLVEDDSLEGTAEPHVAGIDDPRFCYKKRSNPTGGRPAIVRNEAAGRARGRYLYFLDDDDRASPETLVAMVNALDRTGRGVAVGIVRPFGPTNNEVVDQERERYLVAETIMPAIKTRFGLSMRLLFRNSIVVCSACIIRRTVFEKIGGFDPQIPLYEDVGMYIRAIRCAGFTFVPRVLLERRTGEASLLQNERDLRRTTESYRMIHQKYRQEFGTLEYRALQTWAKVSQPWIVG